MTFLYSGLSFTPGTSTDEVLATARKRLKKVCALPQGARLSVYRRSVDARKRNDVRLVYTVAVSAPFSEREEKALTAAGCVALREETPQIVKGNERLSAPPLVVGTGPCGIFAALMLAEIRIRAPSPAGMPILLRYAESSAAAYCSAALLPALIRTLS